MTDTIFIVLSFILGLIGGSFANVCIWRLPHHISIISPRSRCPGCNAAIRWYDNIPLLSYIILKGRCRNCGARISFGYPLVELASALLFVFAFLRWKPSPVFVLCLFLLIPILLSIIAIDWKHGIIPNALVLWLGVVGICSAIANPLFAAGNSSMWKMLLDSAVGGAAGFFILLAIRSIGNRGYHKEAMGLGDVKLFGAIGFLLGWEGVLWVIFLSSTAAAIVGIIFHFKNGRKEIPYGPFIAGVGLAYLLTFPWKLW